MSAANDVGRLISGAVEGAESLGTAAHNLARDKSMDRCHQLVNQAHAFVHGAERLKRAMIDANGAQQESAK
ncbi:MAG: hypothetical protein SH820_17300 [Xanthomonadales bacterium]|nr:hypothetical protein [Xanthomonadales bacterium]